MSKITAIIQARMGSTRLPGKVMKELSGKPILWHVVNRLKYSKKVDQIIVATTTLDEDIAIEEFCINNNILYYRGSSDDVLSRYYEAAKKFNAGTVIRITSDCPMIEPDIIDQMLNSFVMKAGRKDKADYLSNVLTRTFPRGLDTEIFSFEVIEKVYNEATEQYEREHVTPYIYQHPEIFTLENYSNEKDYSFYRWTVDTVEDFQLAKEIYNALYKPGEIFHFDDILHLFELRPELLEINKNVEQKKLNQ